MATSRSPSLEWVLELKWYAGMPDFLALRRANDPELLLTTTATFAFNNPLSQASIMAWRFDPPWEAKIPREMRPAPRSFNS